MNAIHKTSFEKLKSVIVIDEIMPFSLMNKIAWALDRRVLFRLIYFGHIISNYCSQPKDDPNKNRSPKGNMWSAIPVALLCMFVNWSERKQGSGPEGDEVL